MLGAFNEATPDWLSFFMFTFFTDRDGKMQLESLGAVGLRSAVAHLPLHADRGSAPHVRRRDRRRAASSRRTCEAMKAAGIDRSERHRQGAQARRHRSADHPEEGESALLAVARSVRLRGLDQRGERLQHRHQGPFPRGPASRTIISWTNDIYPVLQVWSTARSSSVDEPALTALNMRLRDDYVVDCDNGVEPLEQGDREGFGIPFQIKLPQRRLPSPHRRIHERARPMSTAIGSPMRNGPSGAANSCRPTATATSSRA